MTKFRIIPEEDQNTQTIVLKTDGGNGASFNDVVNSWLTEHLRKTLDKKDDKKDDEKRKPKTYTRSDVTCWSLLLLASAPWTGLWILHALDSAKLQWAQLLLPK